MREIIEVQIGGAGNQIGNKFWEMIADEHGIQSDGAYMGVSDLQLERVNVYFNEASHSRYVPRSIHVDMNPEMAHSTRELPHGDLFNSENFVSGFSSGTGNNFAKGRYSNEGKALAERTLEVIHREVERCDLVQGFQLIHSTGGGCGSGLASLIMHELKDEYNNNSIINSFSMIPAPNLSEIVVENYNAVLTIKHLLDSTDETVIIDNQALHMIASEVLKIESSWSVCNHLIATSVGGVTASFRFPGQLNSDLRKLAVNMVPFPRLHFFAPSFAPLMCQQGQKYQNVNVASLVEQMYDPRMLQAACFPTTGKYLCCASIFRGLIRMSEVESAMLNMRSKQNRQFVDWIPNNYSAAVCDIPPRGLKLAGTFLANTTALKEVFARCLNSFSVMFQRGANLHWYLNEGMEKAEFQEADSMVADLIAEYTHCENSQNPA